MNKLSPFFGLLCLVAILTVTPVHADAKVFESRIIREFSHIPNVSTPFGVFDVDQHLTMFITIWATENGGSRIFNNAFYSVNFLQSGEIVGQGSIHSMINMFVPELHFGETIVNQVDIVVTFSGSGQVANYHLIFVYIHGQGIVFHELGVPLNFYP